MIDNAATATVDSSRAIIGAVRDTIDISRRQLLAPLFLSVATAAFAQPYSSHHAGDVVQLQDARTQTTVSILPSVGNIAVEMSVKGENVLYWPYGSIEEFKARPGMG